MKMFAAKEEKNLTYVLDKAEDEESLMLPEELHGFFGGWQSHRRISCPANGCPLY